MKNIVGLFILIIPEVLFGQQGKLVETNTFGDSLRVEVRMLGDTIHKTFIDLKGTSDDNFDGTYDVKLYYSIWKSKDSLSIDNPVFFDFGYCKIAFNKNDLRTFDKEKLTKFTNYSPMGVVREKERKLKNLKEELQVDTLSNYSKFEYILPDLLSSLDFYFKIEYKKMTFNKIRSERYETGFSGGYWLEFIEENNMDTLRIMKIREWIR